MITIYIHGFSGSGQGSKAKLFREYFKNKNISFIAPSLSYVPELAITTLEEIIESYNGEVNLIGSSMGGFYAIYLGNKYNLNTVLLNPSIYPYKTLSNTSNATPNFYDNSSFEWNSSHLDMLKKYEVKNLKKENFMLLVQKGDELLDYKEAVNKMEGSRMLIEENGNHSFEGVEKHFKEIEFFCNNL